MHNNHIFLVPFSLFTTLELSKQFEIMITSNRSNVLYIAANHTVILHKHVYTINTHTIQSKIVPDLRYTISNDKNYLNGVIAVEHREIRKKRDEDFNSNHTIIEDTHINATA